MFGELMLIDKSKGIVPNRVDYVFARYDCWIPDEWFKKATKTFVLADIEGISSTMQSPKYSHMNTFWNYLNCSGYYLSEDDETTPDGFKFHYRAVNSSPCHIHDLPYKAGSTFWERMGEWHDFRLVAKIDNGSWFSCWRQGYNTYTYSLATWWSKTPPNVTFKDSEGYVDYRHEAWMKRNAPDMLKM